MWAAPQISQHVYGPFFACSLSHVMTEEVLLLSLPVFISDFPGNLTMQPSGFLCSVGFINFISTIGSHLGSICTRAQPTKQHK